MGDPGGGDDVVDAGAVVPAAHQDVGPGLQQGLERAAAGGGEVGGHLVALEHLAQGRAEVEDRRPPTGGRVHVDLGLQAEQRAVHDVGEGVADALGRVGRRGRRPEDAGDVVGPGQALQEQLDHRVELAGRQGRGGQPGPDEGHDALAGADRSAGDRLVALRRRLEGLVDGLVALVDLAAPGHEAADGGPAVEVGGDRPEGLGRGAHLPGDLRRQVPEHVLLAGEVLVEGDPRAAGDGGDAVDAAAVVADLAEDLQGGVEDPLLGPLAPGADVGVVRERGAPDHGRRPVSRRAVRRVRPPRSSARRRRRLSRRRGPCPSRRGRSAGRPSSWGCRPPPGPPGSCSRGPRPSASG